MTTLEKLQHLIHNCEGSIVFEQCGDRIVCIVNTDRHDYIKSVAYTAGEAVEKAFAQCGIASTNPKL
jgi:hypothetical protein